VTVADFELSDSRVFNIGGGEAISLSQLLGKIEETVGRTAKIVYEPRRNFDADQIVLDTSLATRVLGWQPEVNLQEGLSRTWSWMSEYIARS
jgi:nucleoside-diphosphate-sugar epimerase